MILTVRHIFFFVFAMMFSIGKVVTWSDQVHMTITAIAYASLTPTEQKQLKIILMNWRDDSEFNDPIVAGVWADYVKNRSAYAHNFTGRKGMVSLFNTWHYVSRPYNPFGIKISPYEEMYQYRQDLGHNVLKTILRNILSIRSQNGYGTMFSYNFLLRMFIHIFEDIHQPLHTIHFFNSHFPEGDAGGNAIQFIYQNEKRSLHHLCDSVFGTRGRQWPIFTSDKAAQDAKHLMQTYPRTFFKDVLFPVTDYYRFIDYIAEESYEIAKTEIYENLDMEALNGQTEYVISKGSVSILKRMLNERIALTGYRLTYFLKIILNNISRDLIRIPLKL